MKVYLRENPGDKRLLLGEFPKIGLDVGIRPNVRMFDHDGKEIARMLPLGGWRRVVDMLPVGKVYLSCDVEDS